MAPAIRARENAREQAHLPIPEHTVERELSPGSARERPSRRSQPRTPESAPSPPPETESEPPAESASSLEPLAPELLEALVPDALVLDADALRPEQEIAMSREVEELEIAHWRALLADPRMVPHVLSFARAALPEWPESADALSVRANSADREARMTELARALRRSDVERTALLRVDADVQRTVDEPHARDYLAQLSEARARQQAAKHRFVTANLGLVVKLARRYDQAGPLPMADLIQEGNIGLMRAVERFDYQRGYRFSTYASWWIRHGFGRALADRGRMVRVPVHALDDVQRAARASRVVSAKTGREPTLNELAELTGISEEKLDFLREHARSAVPVSLDRQLWPDSDATLLDSMAAPQARTVEDVLDVAEWGGRIEQLLSSLTPMERDIVRSRYGLGGREELTLRELGERYDLSRERIRQLQEQALDKLREAL